MIHNQNMRAGSGCCSRRSRVNRAVCSCLLQVHTQSPCPRKCNFSLVIIYQQMHGLWIFPICQNTGANKGSLWEIVCVNYSTQHTRICCDRFCTFLNWCYYVQYIYTTTYQHSDFTLLFCSHNSVLIM